jgi:AraC-like DNA-binding protein
MTWIHRVSHRPLSDYVEYLWIVDGYFQPRAQELVLPTGSMTLVIDLDVQQADGIQIWGARSRPLVLDTSKPLRLMSAHFKPGGGFPFADCPVGELHNDQVPLTAFWPSESVELRERIAEAQTNSERFQLLERFLIERLRASRWSNPAVRYAIGQFQHPSGAVSVRAVTAQIGMSAQRFIELFRNEVGLPPKVFARLARFQHAVDRIKTGAPIDWADLAVASGYFDQPHFIHDFREFSGVSPSAYLRQRSSRNHVRVAN